MSRLFMSSIIQYSAEGIARPKVKLYAKQLLCGFIRDSSTSHQAYALDMGRGNENDVN